jgi:nucleotide-binding universal stress UspA family protein
MRHGGDGPVVVGYDGKDAAQRALARAVEEAKTRGVQLVVVAVEEMPLDPQGPQNYGSLDDEPLRSIPIEAPPDLQEIFAHAQTSIDAAGVSADYLWAAGDPARVIADAAHDRKASVVVLGAHHHRFMDALLGTDVPAEVERELGADVIRVE